MLRSPDSRRDKKAREIPASEQICSRVFPLRSTKGLSFMTRDLHYVKVNSNEEFHTRSLERRKLRSNFPSMQFRLNHFRKIKGLTQTQVAESLGISVGLYNQLESGKRRMNETYLDGLARLYKVSPVELIVDPVRSDPLYDELDRAYRRMTPAERQILVASAKGIAAGHSED